MRTLYEAIGVGPTARKAEIRAACMALGQRYKDALDAGGDEDAAWSLAEVEQAYETLLDTSKRREYDAELGLHPPRREDEHFWERPYSEQPPHIKFAMGVVALLLLAVYALWPYEQKELGYTKVSPAEQEQLMQRARESYIQNSPVPITEKQLDARDKQVRETEESLRRLTGTQNQNLSERDEARLRKGAESIVDNNRRWAK